MDILREFKGSETSLQLRGHRLSRKDLEESFQKFSDEKMNGKKEDLRPTTCSGLPSSNVR